MGDLEGVLERLADLPRKWRTNDPPFPPGRYAADVQGALNACADELEEVLKEMGKF